MSWTIGLLENTLTISQEASDALLAADTQERFYDTARDKKGLLIFDNDHMEHMDYLGDEEIVAVLTEHKVNGRVVFASLEGDNGGDYWLYDFKEGQLTSQRGKLIDLIPST